MPGSNPIFDGEEIVEEEVIPEDVVINGERWEHREDGASEHEDHRFQEDEVEDAIEVQNDTDDDTDTDVEDIHPDHDLLAPVQQRIKEQLLEQAEEKFLAIKEKKETLKEITNEREAIGVQLYSTQQLLAKLQEEVEKFTDNISKMKKLREEIEQQKSQEYDNLRKMKQETEYFEQRLQKARKDRDVLMEQIIQIEKHNRSIAQNIAAKRRETHKTEEAISGVEREKKEQDYLLDHLYHQKKTLEVEIVELEAQIEQQKSESLLAQETLKEAIAAIEATNYEKKILQQQWKSSLIGTQRRDEALKAIEDGLRKQTEQMQEIENELTGYKASIASEKEQHEQLTSILIRLENEKQYLDRQIESLYETQEQMQDQYNSFQRTLDKTESEIKIEEQQCKIIRQRIESLDKQSVSVANNTKQLEDSAMLVMSDQTTFKKGVQSSLQKIRELNSLARDKEIEFTQVENEIARVRVDLIQKQENNKVLEEMLRQVEKELQAKDRIIEQYEQDIRRRHETIEKKQSELDLLNKTLEKLQSGTEEENLGPLEATIKNLSNSIAQKQQENDLTKKRWIRHQRELVNLLEENEKMTEELRDAKTRQTILLQKKIRLENMAQAEKREIARLEGAMSRMHHELRKLNTFLSKNKAAQRELANANFDIENQILDNLKRKEREAIKLESSVRNTQEEKSRLIEELIEVERQVMYWEKKIEIQKEIQDTLDPQVGQDEVQRMKKEVHIMEQRLLELKRNHKRMVHEMERSVGKREIILTKGKAASNSTQKSGATMSSLRSDIAHLERQLNKKRSQSRNTFERIKQLQKQTEEIAEEVVQTKEAIAEKQESTERLRSEVGRLSLVKARVLGDKKCAFDLYQLYDTIRKGSYAPRSKESEVALHVQQQEERKEKILNVVVEMRNNFPTYAALLDIVAGVLE